LGTSTLAHWKKGKITKTTGQQEQQLKQKQKQKPKQKLQEKNVEFLDFSAITILYQGAVIAAALQLLLLLSVFYYPCPCICSCWFDICTCM